MIIIDNNYEIGGVIYKRTVSDANLMIRKVGTEEAYSEAIDLPDATWIYEETDILIELDEEIPDDYQSGYDQAMQDLISEGVL